MACRANRFKPRAAQIDKRTGEPRTPRTAKAQKTAVKKATAKAKSIDMAAWLAELKSQTIAEIKKNEATDCSN